MRNGIFGVLVHLSIGLVPRLSILFDDVRLEAGIPAEARGAAGPHDATSCHALEQLDGRTTTRTVGECAGRRGCVVLGSKADEHFLKTWLGIFKKR